MPTVSEDPVATGRAGGIRSGEVRRAKAAVRKDLLARQAFADASEDIAKMLLKAARGEDEFSELDPKDRVAILKTCLEYGVGRPRSQDPLQADETEEAQTGIRFGVRQETPDGEATRPDAGAAGEHPAGAA
jgi:hypothetical protein